MRTKGQELDKIVGQQFRPKSIRVLELIRIDFDNLENRSSEGEVKKSLGLFKEDPIVSAYSKLDLKVKNLKVKPYLGWNQKVYPKFEVKEVTVY